jgi:N-acetylglucosaminyldiphosphoundecaprenol N-acetyl-beta-D-mannosaminyltransferase
MPTEAALTADQPTLALHSGYEAAVAETPANSQEPMRFGAFSITETGPFPPRAGTACWIYITLNAEIALSLPHAPVLQALVQSPRTRTSIDGQWLWWAMRRKYPKRPLKKLSGSDLIYRLAAHAARHGKRLLLVGSTPRCNALAVQALQARWPGLQVSGYAPPPFEAGSAQEAQVQQEILGAVAACCADHVVLGLGAAKEHALARRMAPLLDGRVAGLLCFGGAIEFASGTVRRAPPVLQRLGLEGVFRVLQQPARAWRLIKVLRVLPVLARLEY